MPKRLVCCALFVLVLIFGAIFTPTVQATEQYARDTGQGCIFCHQESTGGQLKTVGFAYIRSMTKDSFPGSASSMNPSSGNIMSCGIMRGAARVWEPP